jgi:cell volume regulation protein A
MFLYALILLAIIFVASFASKWRVPLVVISLFAGMLFGTGALGLVPFDDPSAAQKIADYALVFVLFIGGFVTRQDRLQKVFAPAMILATAGVIMTAAITIFLLPVVFGFFHIEIRMSQAILIGCIVASTDAAAVFSILRTRSLDPKLSALVEIESATNDPMAIILTTVAVQIAVAQAITSTGMGMGIPIERPFSVVLTLVWQTVGGVGFGLLIGAVAVFLSKFVANLDKGYFYIYIISIVMLSYGVADLAKASGILSAFFAGFVLGNSKKVPYKSTSATLLDALSTMGNVVIFVVLGLLVSPQGFVRVYKEGILLFLILTFVARPAVIAACMYFFKYSVKDKVFVAWSGLRGAVPMVLATYPAAAEISEGVSAGLDNDRYILNTIFFAVLLSMVIQGSTITKLADMFKLATRARFRPRQVMELVSLHNSGMELVEIDVDDDVYSGEALVSSFRLPRGTTITMVNRGDKIKAPTGQTLIRAGDILYVLVKTEERDNAMEEILRHFRSNTKTVPIVTDYEEVDKRR